MIALCQVGRKGRGSDSFYLDLLQSLVVALVHSVAFANSIDDMNFSVVF